MPNATRKFCPKKLIGGQEIQVWLVRIVRFAGKQTLSKNVYFTTDGFMVNRAIPDVFVFKKPSIHTRIKRFAIESAVPNNTVYL